MNINVTDETDYTLVELDGDVDLSCSPVARKTILEVLDNDKNLLVNLSSVTYIDSSGIASLVEGYQMAKKQELEFGLVNVSEPVMSVLKLARLDKVFPLFDSVDDYRASR